MNIIKSFNNNICELIKNIVLNGKYVFKKELKGQENIIKEKDEKVIIFQKKNKINFVHEFSNKTNSRFENRLKYYIFCKNKNTNRNTLHICKSSISSIPSTLTLKAL